VLLSSSRFIDETTKSIPLYSFSKPNMSYSSIKQMESANLNEASIAIHLIDNFACSQPRSSKS